MTPSGVAATADGAPIYRAGRIHAKNIPIAAPIVVNYLDDEATRMRARGELVGPWRPWAKGGIATASGCSFNIDCDDCDPCTDDRCLIFPGDQFGDGKCANPPQPENHTPIPACQDGLFCNGIETCSGGVCELPGTGTGFPTQPEDKIENATCVWGGCVGGLDHGDPCLTDDTCRDGTCTFPAACDERQNLCTAPCTATICSADADNKFAPCVDDLDCTGGHCQSPDEMCDDGLACNGAEVCDTDPGSDTYGQCSSEGNPCGFGADCSERTCLQPARQPCTTNTNCGVSGQCVGPEHPLYTGPGCYPGRCCTEQLDGSFTCSIKKEAACTTGGGIWSATADGRLAQGACPSCPRYSSGVSPVGTTTVTVGPVSNAACGKLLELGDDYTFSVDEYLAVDTLTFVGGVETVAESRISFEFYDSAGVFIEDTFFVSGSGIAVRTVEFDPPITVPSTGYVVARVAGAFSPNGRIYWNATDAVDIGQNAIASLWVKTDPNALTGGPVPDFLKVCVGGVNDGLWCNPGLDVPGSDCPGGICELVNNVLEFELAGAPTPAPIGACCDLLQDLCTPNVLQWECEGNHGVFRGIGQLCAVCSDDSPNPLGVCTNDLDCRLCLGNLTISCADDTDCGAEGPCGPGTCIAPCQVGACCETGVGTCIDGVTETECTTPGTTFENGGMFAGFGTDCEPDCCPQPVPSGGDDCADTSPHLLVLPVNGVCADGPNKGQPCDNPGDCANRLCSRTISVTISGDNSTASGPDRCASAEFDYELQDVENADPGWWESFSIDDCAFVRLDLCCSDPLHAPQWVIMWNACPCQDGQQFFNSVNPNRPTDPANARGAPVCETDDNLWWQYGPLREGTYYQPIYSALAGAHGPYQLHIRAEACPRAACCHLQCSQTGVACPLGTGCATGEYCLNGTCIKTCKVNTDCVDYGGTCEPVCDVTDVIDCTDVAGVFQAPPLRDTATPLCTPDPCQVGSCCLGPGDCQDSKAVDSFLPISKSDCDGYGGKYIGGLRCGGGSCVDGDCIGCSCASDADCSGVDGSCLVREGESLDQPNPCPICEIEDDLHCQTLDEVENGRISDLCVGDCPDGEWAKVADDFTASESGDLTSVCFEGVYALQPAAGQGDCANSRTPERISVTLFEDLGGVPGAPVAGIGTQRATILASGIDGEVFGVFNRFRYYVGLPTPVPLIQGRTYWLEIYLDTNGLDDDGNPAGEINCDWFWNWGVPRNAAQGNAYSTWQEGVEYNVNDVFPGADFFFCTSIANTVPPTPVRPCCTCPTGGGGVAAGGDPNCQELTADECISDRNGDWRFEAAECAGFSCPNSGGPPSDDCIDAIEVFDGHINWNNFCATSSPVPLDQVNCGAVQTTAFTRDLWFKYVATETEDWRFSLCSDEGEFNTVMALYSNGTGVCPCPTDAATQLTCNNDGCQFSGSGSEIVWPVEAGVCYTIRVGGVGGAQGLGELTVGRATPLFIPPPAIVPDSGAALGNRYLAFEMPTCTGCSDEAIRVKFVSLQGFPLPNPAYLWVGDPIAAPDEDSSFPGATFSASPLVCDPVFRSWAGVGRLGVHGAEVMPGAEYVVQRVDLSCPDLATEDCYSPAVTMKTAKYGDVWDILATEPKRCERGPNDGELCSLDTDCADDPSCTGGICKCVFPPPQPDFNDISSLVRKFQSSGSKCNAGTDKDAKCGTCLGCVATCAGTGTCAGGLTPGVSCTDDDDCPNNGRQNHGVCIRCARTAPRKSVGQLQPNTVFPLRPIDFRDIAADVASFTGTAFAAVNFGPCTCPSIVTCGARACGNDNGCKTCDNGTYCTADAECVGIGGGKCLAGRYCIDGFCTDRCGRCTP